MRYNLESTLPINAFSPRGGRSPFSRGMTLEGGGGGGIGGALGGITKGVSGVLGGVAKGVTNVVKGVVQPVYNATLKQIPGVDQALVGLDKSVGQAIPGGWGTVASVAASFIPGAQLGLMTNGLLTPTRLAVGLGALSGSGVMRKGNQFNLQGAIMGGAMAYGASQIAAGLENAAEPATNATTKAIEESAKAETANIAANLGVEGASTGAGSQAAMLAQQNAGFGAEGLSSINSAANQAIQSNIQNVAATPDVFSGLAGTQGAAPVLAQAQPTGLQSLATGAKELGTGTLENIAKAGEGIKNLTGFGEPSISSSFKAFQEPITQAGLIGGVLGAAGLSELENQKSLLQQQYQEGSIAQDEYNAELANIDAQIATANQAVSENPFNADPDRTPTKTDTLYASKPATSTLYDRSAAGATSSSTLYAAGGSVDDETGIDEGSYGTGYASGGKVEHFASGGSTDPNDPEPPYPGTGFAASLGLGIDRQVERYNAWASRQSARNQAEYDRQQAAPGVAAVAENPWKTEVGLGSIQNVGSGGKMMYEHNPMQVQGGDFTSKVYQQQAAPIQQAKEDKMLYSQVDKPIYEQAKAANVTQYAAGGMPRFLSGGGDGMSDSIKANIEGSQEARLADGEFVIPADVVSHLGNGSSKAGAKQLYSMMDRVRSARTGNKKQGKQINPRKYMAA